MKTYALIVTLLLMLCTEESFGALLIQPPESKLIAKSVDTNNIYAEFNGQIRVKGAVIAQWVYIEIDMPPALMIQLVPDESSIKALPYFAGFPVNSISLNDSKKSLRRIIGNNYMKQIESKKIMYIKAFGSFTISNYNVGVDCDKAWARGELVSFEVIKPIKHEGTGIEHGC